MLQKRLSPTLLACLAFCNRLFFLNMEKPHHGTQTVLTVLGKFEHSVIEQFYKLTKNYWKTQNEFEDDNSLEGRISLAVHDSVEIGRKNFPTFFDQILENSESMKYRLRHLNQIKSQEMRKLLKKGMPFSTVLSLVMPFVTEKWLESKVLGIGGFADFLYWNSDGSITVEDIKSHNDRYDAFIHRSSHLAQGVTYAIMAEEVYGKPVKKFQIFYSKDCYTESFTITKKLKQELIDSIKQVPDILAGDMPDKLEGPENIKCKNCYSRDFCFSIDKPDSQEGSFYDQ